MLIQTLTTCTCQPNSLIKCQKSNLKRLIDFEAGNIKIFTPNNFDAGRYRSGKSQGDGSVAHRGASKPSNQSGPKESETNI